MKFIKILFLVHFLLVGDFILSQVNLDSLFGVWNDESKADSCRLKAMDKISWDGYLYSKPDSAFYYSQLEYDFALKVDNKKYMSKALNTQGALFYFEYNYEKALEYYEKSLKISEEIGYKKGMESSYSYIATIYLSNNNYKKALEYNEKTFKIYEELGDKRGMMRYLGNIGGIYKRMSNYEKARECFEKSLKISEEIGYKKGMEISYSLIGGMYIDQGNNEKALEYFEKSLKTSDEIGDKRGMVDSYNITGFIYYKQGNYEKALEHYEKSLKIREELGDKIGIGYTFHSIGLIYKDQGNYEKGLEYYQKSFEIFEEIGNKGGMMTYYEGIGVIYREQGNYDKALEYLEKCIKTSEELGDKIRMGSSLGNIGLIYKEQGNYDKALEYYEKCLKISEELGDKSGMVISYNKIGNLYDIQGKYEKALEYLLKAKKIKEEINVITGLDGIAKALIEVYEKLGKPQKALENYKLYINIKDSLAKMDAEKQLYKFEIDKNYELEKQADSIKYANEIVLHQAEAKTQKQRSNGLALIALIVILSLVIVFRQLKTVKKGKLLVEERNIVIEEKQKEITDSINYAKRLQDGILVPFDLVQTWLSESFILFRPKDIVSGDFYWIEKIGDKIYFAVADCTGHGIPGALVSIICSNALSKSLQEDEISSPAKILDATRKMVEERFVRAADSIKDGMDISLCCLDVKTKTITWSGAMNPLWIVKKDAKEIQELKPDRQAIGMVENPKPFTEHKIKLVVGDSIYLFSDGYIDQFGGLNGKKYMKGKMKKFVLSLQNQSMQEQLVSFDKEFNSWKGNRDQIDDVCVMGVKVT